MKQTLLAAVLAAIASSALTLLLAGSAAPAPPSAPSAGAPATAAEFKAALADLEREVAALRRDLAAGGAGPADSPAGDGTAPPASRIPASPAAPVVREAKSPEPAVPAPEGLKRFAEAVPRNAENERDVEGRSVQKRRWLFRGEREILEWFGLPDTVHAEGEKETWYYEIPTGTVDEDGWPQHRNYWITLNRGRLTDMGD